MAAETRRPVRIPPIVLVLTIAAFAIDHAWAGGLRRSVSVVDPAGVEIVVNHAPVWGNGAGWSVDPDPVLQVGAVDGARPYLFQDIAGATRLSDGRLVVLERGPREFRVFDPSGAHLVSFGRPGEGPGEFGAVPEWIVTEGDTLLAYDPYRSRYTWFTLDGRVVRESQTDRLAAAEELRSMRKRERYLFANGSVLRADPGLRVVEDLRGLATGSALGGLLGERSRTEVRLSIADSRGMESGDLGAFPSTETIRLRVAGASRAARIANPYFPAVHYGIDRAAGRVHVAMPGMKEIRTFDRDGVLERVVRQEAPLHPLTPEMIEASLAGLLQQPGAAEFGPSAVAAAFGLLSVPDSVFPYSGIEVDTEGNLWLLDRYRITRDGPEPYQLFDAEGSWLGALELPRGIGRVLERGDDYIVTQWLDEVDVPYLRVYQLVKGAG